jgi:hypothetical protein
MKAPKNIPKTLTAKLNKPTANMFVDKANPNAAPKTIPSKGDKK